MLKKLLIAVSLFAIVLMLALSYVTARFIDHEEILRAKTEAEQLRASRDSLLFQVAERDSVEKVLQARVGNLLMEAETLRAHVAELEEIRKEMQLSVRRLRRKEDLQARLVETFPEMAAENWGVTKLRDEVEDVEIEYLLVPLWFSETFIINHKNAESYKAQRDSLKMLDTLQTEVIALQDTIFHLEQANRIAFQTGYNAAFAKYETLNGKYIDLLQKPPQIKMGLPRWTTLFVTAVGGVVVGTQIK